MHEQVSSASIRKTLQVSSPRNVPEWRVLRRGWSNAVNSWPAKNVIPLGLELIDLEPWGRLTAYELIACHPFGIDALTPSSIDQLAQGMDDWASVDTLACDLAGPAWSSGDSVRVSSRQRNTQMSGATSALW